MKKKIDLLLESKYSDTETKLYHLKDIFKLSQFKSLDKNIHQWFVGKRETYEIIDLYLEYMNTLETGLNDFKNLKSINDILELKKLLQDRFIADETSEKLKMLIIQVLSNFPQHSDNFFFENALANYSTYQDFQIANIIFNESAKSLKYLKDSDDTYSQNKSFWINIEQGNNENAIIMNNNAVFFLWSAENLYKDLHLPTYTKLIGNKLLNNYFYNNPYFLLFNGKEVGCKIEYNVFKGDDKRIKLNFLLVVDEEVYIDEKNLDAVLFTEVIHELINAIKTKQLQNNDILIDKRFIVGDYISGEPHIIFNFEFIQKIEEYALTISSKNRIKSTKKLGPIEIISMLEESEFHLSILTAKMKELRDNPTIS